MSTNRFTLAPLLSTHNLKLVCIHCCVKEKEITYSLKSVGHQCERNLLLCRAKGAGRWRPVCKRPEFPKPQWYQVCYFFKEGSGCTMHENRCTYARSEEEALVWTFNRRHGLDHALLCHLIAQSEEGRDQPEHPNADILATLDLKAVCELCSVQEREITYAVKSFPHKCGRNLLLAKAKASDQWRPVSERPTHGNFGRNVLYQKCCFFVEGSGCMRHGQGCNFARSCEEATVWNYVRDETIDNGKLIKRLIGSEPIPITPESASESLLQRFSGEFVELCKDCFNDRPQKLAAKRLNATCSAESAHAWNPVLVHHLSEARGKQVYSQVRSPPQHSQFNYCSHVVQGKSCWHEPSHCQSAQSDVEMAVWVAERGGLSVRPHLLQLARGEHGRTYPAQEIYCRICLLVFPSTESFYEHRNSLEHARLLYQDSTTKWTGRHPAHNLRAELCDRPETCEYGNRCPKAHSAEELQEWMMRAAEEKEIRQNIDAQGFMSYSERLLEEYRNSSDEGHILSEQIDDVSVSCDEDLTVSRDQIDATLQWNLRVETERQLVHVALLKQEPGASFSLGAIRPHAPCIYSSGEYFVSDDTTYEITVSFTSVNPGLYEQWLALDFNSRPVLLRKLRVRVGQRSSDDSEDQAAADDGVAFRKAERWHPGNRVIVPCLSRTEEEDELDQEYKPPQIMSSLYESHQRGQSQLKEENYKERMHHFLYAEEQAEDQVVSRLTVCGEISTLKILSRVESGMMIAPEGRVFCAVSIPSNVTPDTPEGRVLKRSVKSALMAPLFSNDQNSKVYEAKILQVKTSESKIYLQPSEKCCCDLALKSNESYQMEVQFQLHRYNFCTMHKAVDLLPDTKRVLPDLENCGVPVNNIRCEKLNTEQQSAFDFVTGSVQKFVAPLLIYGPFGTGKTFTLATAARQLCKQPDNKVLVCTHTNSSADLYVREHFHPFIDKENDGMQLIRIKANTQTALFATDKVTLKHCFLSANGQTFLPPSKAVLDRHKVIVITTAMAFHFYNLKLPEDYFTHILIDEASQMLECEALMALGLAGPNTRVVLAGDHMQMGPKLFSVDVHRRSDYTLLNRLFHCYQGQKCDAAQSSRIIFNKNYRSTKEIVEFVSAHFYVGKNDVIKAAGNIPPPSNGRALKFHHARGECLLDPVSMSWYNKEEIAKVVKEVREILEHWPLTWGTKNNSSVCVLSEGCQVRQIRTALSRKGLAEVHVENIENVQGKQFRAVVMTAVHTRDSLKTSHLHGLELFNDASVLNTAMTRAQSHMVVVGDAAALCCFGQCSGVWKSYIDHCISNNSVAPHHFTKDFFEKDVMETARFQKSEPMDESSTIGDAILQELKDQYEQLESEHRSEEGKLDLDDFDQHISRSSCNISDVGTDFSELCKKQPKIYQHGTLFRESYNRAYVIPFQDPTRSVRIKGKANLRQVFTGDEVVLQNTRVVSITKEEESSRLVVCLLEDHRKARENNSGRFVNRMMMPLKRSEPKICILITKHSRNFLPIWKQIDGDWVIVGQKRLNENLKQNNVFLVKVVSWKKKFYNPFGYVVDILPVGGSLDEGLRLLNEELKVEPTTCTSGEGFSWEDEDETHRQDLCEVFTFTVDPSLDQQHIHMKARELDDAISVREIGDYYELGVHIADVASFVIQGGALDEDAKQRGSSYYCSGGKPIHMFPKDSVLRFSLLSGKKRRVVSLMFKVKKQTNEISGRPKFHLSWIRSNKQLSYEEAETIIWEGHRTEPRFDTVDDCVRVAHCFAKAQRKIRLLDWAYSQPDGHRLPGEREANLMIEELSVLFNTRASEVLIDSEITSHCTPLRCQSEPDPGKIEEFRKKTHAALIPLSFHVRHKVECDGRAPNCETFQVLTNVWKEIQSAARADDVNKMVDMIAADDIHPPLQPVIRGFKMCSSKAYVIRSNSSPQAEVGHYSLNVRSYTQATSPIRRYLDVILQRLLHSIICDRQIKYTRREISALCNQCEQNIRCAKEYEQRAEQISYAVSMRRQSTPKTAFVLSADPMTESFALSFPLNSKVFAESLSIMYKDLDLWDQPLCNEENHCMTLTWKKTIYAGDIMQISKELTMPARHPCIELPLNLWKATIEAIDKENWDQARCLVQSVNTDLLEEQNILPRSSEMPLSEAKVQYGREVDINLQLRAGDTLHIQMTSEIIKGYNVPTVQLVHIKPHFEICVDHIHNPTQCFSRSADDPSRDHYNNPEEYVRIWKPLCEMESATNTVAESDSIVIEDLVVNFRKEQEDKMTGSFFLPQAWIDEWAFDCDLSRCLLCIRKRGIKLPTPRKHSTMVDPTEFTWVAHGVGTKVEKKKNQANEGSEVEFYVNHLPMEYQPDCVFQENTSFTVEMMLKLLPHVRNEHAVTSISIACDLVKAIVLNQRIPKAANAVWHTIRKELPAGQPELNMSQRQAVAKALNSSFTLIQGPPGTGKTIVGVHIVYNFIQLNTSNPRRFVGSKEKKKKEVILYCGPSNKSVDVVAGFILKFGESLRPLRVYSKQMEILDYPHPVCTLKNSRRNQRQERAKPELRSITLHHRIREDQNPFSGQIKDFDQRIQRVLAKEIEISAQEVKEYKRLLRNAQAYEFEQHDIILCTCTQSSTPSLVNAVSARQILIDECAMTTEPQSLVPLVCNNPEKIVLIGDHKQLNPIVKNTHVRKLGMGTSLFERYTTMHKNTVMMLDTQYRMHVDISEFPSNEYYEGKLITGVDQPSSVLCVDNKAMPIVFGDIIGTTISLVVNTAKGNEKSKANKEERHKAVDIAAMLVETARIEQHSIAILSPYNSQVSEIRNELRERRMDDITVSTITKSQGSEWRYVIISTVCSLPSEEIEQQGEADGAWLAKHVGFVGYPNQINVGITRAKEGLCIIGNQKLLYLVKPWRKLLNFYKGRNALTTADKISVFRAR